MYLKMFFYEFFLNFTFLFPIIIIFFRMKDGKPLFKKIPVYVWTRPEFLGFLGPGESLGMVTRIKVDRKWEKWIYRRRVAIFFSLNAVQRYMMEENKYISMRQCG